MMRDSSLYFQPKTLGELQTVLPEMTKYSAVLAGGTDLMPRLRQSQEAPDIYLSLCGIEELKQITLEQGHLRIGAMVTHNMAAHDPLIEQYFYGLKMACERVGSQQIRNKGTLCGSIANASPAGDIMPCAFLYGGVLEIMGSGGTQSIKAEDFQRENGKAGLEAGEVITALLLPVREGLKSCFVKLGSRKEVTIAQISMCAAWNEPVRGTGANACGEMEACEGRKAYEDRNVCGDGKACGDGNACGEMEACESRKAYGDLRVCVGAVDLRPVEFAPEELAAAAEGEQGAAKRAAAQLSALIRDIRMHRQRESKLKLTEAEKLYKERAAGGVIDEMVKVMKAVENLDVGKSMDMDVKVAVNTAVDVDGKMGGI